MKFKQVTLFGASGLIGSYLLKYLLKDSEVHLINVISRKPFYLKHDKINNIIIALFLEIEFDAIGLFFFVGCTLSRGKSNKSLKI